MRMVRRIAGMFRRKLTTSGGKELHDRSRLQPVRRLARLKPQSRDAQAARCPQAVQKELPVTRYSAIALVLLAASSANAAEKTSSEPLQSRQVDR